MEMASTKCRRPHQFGGQARWKTWGGPAGEGGDGLGASRAGGSLGTQAVLQGHLQSQARTTPLAQGPFLFLPFKDDEAAIREVGYHVSGEKPGGGRSSGDTLGPTKMGRTRRQGGAPTN